MSELDDIKARAAELTLLLPYDSHIAGSHDPTPEDYAEMKVMLDRAIANWQAWEDTFQERQRLMDKELDKTRVKLRISEKANDMLHNDVGDMTEEANRIANERDEARAAVLALREELRRAGDVLQTAYSAGNELGRCGVSLSPDWPKIQDQSYEEVGEFLYPDITKGGVEFYDRLAETEHYEAFRQA